MENDDDNKTETNKIIIRRANIFDYYKIDDVNRKCLNENYSFSIWIELISMNFTYVAVYNKKIVGYISIASLSDVDLTQQTILFKNTLNKNEKLYCVVSLAVLEEYRNMKIGNELMKIINPNFNIFLNVRVNNLIAQNLYKKHGFKIFGKIEKNYYQNPQEDAYLMVRMNHFN